MQILETNTSHVSTDLKNIETPPDKEILSCFNSKKISEANQIDFDKVIVPAVSKIFALAGKRDDKNLSDQLNLIYSELPGELRANVPNMRLNEIPLALKRGIYKEYGEYFGLNVAEFVRFCKEYCNSAARVNTVKAIQKPVQRPITPPSRAERWPIFKENLFSAFKKWENSGNYDSIAPALYDVLSDLKLIIVSSEQKYKFMELAGERVISDTNLKLSVLVSDYDRKPLKAVVGFIQASMAESKPLPDHVWVIVLAKTKKLILDAFFLGITGGETGLQTLINFKHSEYLNLPG